MRYSIPRRSGFFVQNADCTGRFVVLVDSIQVALRRRVKLFLAYFILPVVRSARSPNPTDSIMIITYALLATATWHQTSIVLMSTDILLLSLSSYFYDDAACLWSRN
jgi:hypothetical protein